MGTGCRSLAASNASKIPDSTRYNAQLREKKYALLTEKVRSMPAALQPLPAEQSGTPPAVIRIAVRNGQSGEQPGIRD
jgi:hypothetical protein